MVTGWSLLFSGLVSFSSAHSALFEERYTQVVLSRAHDEYILLARVVYRIETRKFSHILYEVPKMLIINETCEAQVWSYTSRRYERGNPIPALHAISSR